MYEGARVQADETPAMLNMEDGDQIDAHIEQVSFILASTPAYPRLYLPQQTPYPASFMPSY